MEITVKDELKINPRNTIYGQVTVTEMTERPILGPHGEILNPASIRRVHDMPNMIVHVGRAIIAELMTPGERTVVDPITYFEIGNGEVDPPEPPSPDDIALKGPIAGGEFTFEQVSIVSPVSRIYTTVIDQNVATGYWNEIALKTADRVLFARRTYPTQDKAPDVFLIFRWIITF